MGPVSSKWRFGWDITVSEVRQMTVTNYSNSIEVG